MKEYRRITVNDVRDSDEVRALIDMQSRYLETLGYTEHGVRHVSYVSKTTANILRETGADARLIELGEIAGWLHDVGNSLSRAYHGLTGGTLAYGVLVRLGMDPDEAAHISNAISNHEEETGVAGDALSAALILADKSDAHRSRINKKNYDEFDIHDRVNYSVKRSELEISTEKKEIELKLQIDTSFCSVMDYFEIFLGRMILCRKAAERLGLRFRLSVNGQILL